MSLLKSKADRSMIRDYISYFIQFIIKITAIPGNEISYHWKRKKRELNKSIYGTVSEVQGNRHSIFIFRRILFLQIWEVLEKLY